MCHTTHSRSTTRSSRRSIQESVGMDIDNVSQSSSSSSSSSSFEGSDDGSMAEEGAYAFSHLKRNAELQHLNPEADGRTKQQRHLLVSNLHDCFSVSSLEIDLDDHDEDENDDMERSVSRFSARSSRLGSMDFSIYFFQILERKNYHGRLILVCNLD